MFRVRGGDGAGRRRDSSGALRRENATYRKAPGIGVLVLTQGELLRLDFGRFPSWMLLNLELCLLKNMCLGVSDVGGDYRRC